MMNSKIDTSKTEAVITGIRWERIHLYIGVAVYEDGKPASPEDYDFFAADQKLGTAGVYFDVLNVSGNEAELYVNITNVGNHQCIQAGTYSILACKGEDILAECVTKPEVTPLMDDRSRGFLHGNLRKAYNVNFYVEDDSDILPFRMNVVNLSSANLLFPFNGSLIKKIMRSFGETLGNSRAHLRRTYKILYVLNLPRRKKRILFMSEQNTALGSNLTSILDRMKERGLDKEFKIDTSARKWSANNSKFSMLRVVSKLAKSEMVFIDDHAPLLDWLKLHNTTLVQTWHAGAGFKSSGYSRWGHMGCPAPQSCHRQYKYGLCGSKKIAHFFSEVWGINTENVLNTGMPRMDEYQDPEYRQKTTKELYEKFPMCKGKKVILFAPTYRGKNNTDAHYPYEMIDWDRLNEVCSDKYVVLFKMHPWVIKDIEIPEKYSDKMIDVKTYPNINDLFYITDLLITDYSSNIYEYSLMRRPMLFFAFDEIQYSFSRGFHRPYRESAPGKVCETFGELMDAIEKEDFEFEKVEDYVKTQFDHFDSKACDRVIDWIILGNTPDDIKEAIDKKTKKMKRMEQVRFFESVE